MAVTVLDAKTTVGDTGPVQPSTAFDKISLQGFVVGTGAVSATVVFEGSNNGTDWVTISTLTMTGNARAVDGGVATALWERMRARVTAISGTGAAVTVTAFWRLV